MILHEAVDAGRGREGKEHASNRMPVRYPFRVRYGSMDGMMFASCPGMYVYISKYLYARIL